MTKDLTAVTQNRIRYWRFASGLTYATDGQTTYSLYRRNWVDISGARIRPYGYVPDSAILLSGIPLAYTQTNNEASEPHK